MTLIEIVRAFCARRGLARPGAAVGSANAGELQYAALMDEMLDNMTSRKAFRGITREALHTTVAAELQGTITTICDGGFQRILPDTFWDRSTSLRVGYGLTPEEWQRLHVTGSISGLSHQARLRGQSLYAYPAPAAGHVWAFEYVSTWGVVDGASGAIKQYFTRDDDTCFLPDAVCIAWLNYAWKREKGFEYAEALRTFEGLIGFHAGHEGGPQKASLAPGGDTGNLRGLSVSEGSWPLT